MPVDRTRYPDNWTQIALAIKEGCGWVCQFCGMQCRRPGEPFDTHRRTMSVHHLGAPKPDGSAGDPHDKMDCRPINLVGLCSKCHLRADLPIHMANAARTRFEKRINIGQMPLPLVEVLEFPLSTDMASPTQANQVAKVVCLDVPGPAEQLEGG